jgi:integrase
MATESLTLSGNAYDNFVNTIKSEVTLECYNNAIKRFMLYLNITDVNNLLILGKDQLEIQQKIINYILYLKKDKGLSAVSIVQYIAGIIHFYSMNDIVLNRKIGRYIPEHVRLQKDRAYTIEEILRLLEFCDLRSRAIILLFASTGVRIGAVPILKIENLNKIEKYGLYQFTVYAGYKEEYICFCTPECAKAIDAYLSFRERCGEVLTEKSPLFREQFDVSDLEQVRKKPKKVIINTLAKSISQKLHVASIIPISELKEGELASKKRKAVMRTHGFRKFVNTTMIKSPD